MKKKNKPITDYDNTDTTAFINPAKNLSLKDMGFQLPLQPPTQVVSIRLPTTLLNRLRAKASQDDIPYQALIKGVLSNFVRKHA